jgi:excisionase family DNA binding protein
MIPTPEQQPTLSVEQAAQYLGLGRSAAYAAASRGEIPTLRFGRTLRVPTSRLRVMLGLDPELDDSPAAAIVPIRREAKG